MTGLESGNYTWTRAPDAAYSGSPVSMGEFSLGEAFSRTGAVNLISGFSPEQNYPNPFSGVTTIQFLDS
ncbi:MAG: hypothetical protein IPH20_20245 [Bacteroidales bacterium]|nr:hypothetical protein [Bacteroidales bacterium]